MGYLTGIDDPSDATMAQVYTYTAEGKLTQGNMAAWPNTFDYTYDANGNRTDASTQTLYTEWQPAQAPPWSRSSASTTRHAGC